jgi:hypothetical protein
MRGTVQALAARRLYGNMPDRAGKMPALSELFQLFVHFREGVDGEFQILA